jgi:leader peptidase (prepilin peptidase)/N-methyltransferase
MDFEGALPVFTALSAPCVGSFISAIGDRLPQGRTVMFDYSRCESCAKQLRWRELIPIWSWIIQGGICRYCGARIGWPVLCSELSALGVALWALLVLPTAALLPGVAFGWTLLLLAILDFKTMRLPDSITLSLLAAGLATAAILVPTELADHLLGAVLGYASLTLLAIAYENVRGRVGLGGGDAKLFAAIGAWVGWQGLPSVLLISGLAGLAYALLRGRGRLRPHERIPFGPALALGGWMIWLYGPLVLS